MISSRPSVTITPYRSKGTPSSSYSDGGTYALPSGIATDEGLTGRSSAKRNVKASNVSQSSYAGLWMSRKLHSLPSEGIRKR